MSTKAVRGSVASLVWCPLTGLDQDKGGDLWGCQYSLYNGSCPSALGLLPGSHNWISLSLPAATQDCAWSRGSEQRVLCASLCPPLSAVWERGS